MRRVLWPAIFVFVVVVAFIWGQFLGRKSALQPGTLNITADYDRVTVTVDGRSMTLAAVLLRLNNVEMDNRANSRDVWRWWKRFRFMCPEMMPTIATGPTLNFQPLADEGDRLRYNRCGDAMTINYEE